MILSKLYCSSEKDFPKIDFREGLNVVFARIKDYKATDKDVHNLGKTFLTTVIDFALMAGLGKEHPFRRHPERFGHLSFFLEIITYSGQVVTIRRPVTGRASIRIHVTEETADLSALPLDSWTFKELSDQRAKTELNSLLGLVTIQPYEFRKGLGYFLRRQNDYVDLYRISKFGRGRDLDWKPFMALLLGFDWKIVSDKYEMDDRIKAAKREIDLLESDAGARTVDLDEVNARIEFLQVRTLERRKELDGFTFYEADLETTKTIVEDLEAGISEHNTTRYQRMSQLGEISQSIETDLAFDLDRIERLFREAEVAFPEQLKRNYDDLVAFNRDLSVYRKERLEVLRVRISDEIEQLNRRLSDLDERLAEAMSILQNAKVFERYKSHQRQLLKDEEALLALQSQRERLDVTSQRVSELRTLEMEQIRLRGAIESMVTSPPNRYVRIRKLFSEIAEEVLGVFAVLSIKVNMEGNLEFGHHITKDSLAKLETSEGSGFSYQKMLCVCFDLALLCSFSGEPFYRFVYHDGMFEALDDRRKNRMVAKIRSLIADYGIQYILTVIDSDLPRDPADNKLFFEQDEIIRELHDQGDEGRLFPGPVF